MLVSASSRSFQGAFFIHNNRPFLPYGSAKRGLVLCSYKEEYQTVKQTSPPFTPSELTLPLASQSSPSSQAKQSNGTEIKPAEPTRVPLKDDYLPSTASHAIEKTTVAQIAIYGGLIAGGLYLLEAILNSFEVIPLLPETLQIIGVLYTTLLASQLFQGKPLSLIPSPVKAITELVEHGGIRVQRMNLDLPQDLDVRVLATMKKLSRERDNAVNEVEDLRRRAADYARVVAEKEALEAVAMQIAQERDEAMSEVLRRRVADYARVVAEKEALEAVAMQIAQERDEAMSEVIALKQAVDTMSDRMHTIEKTLQQELEPLKQSSWALETVALQLASERDSALKELSELKEELALTKYKEEKTALESLASQLSGERDQSNSENEILKKILADLQTTGTPASGLSPEQELSQGPY